MSCDILWKIVTGANYDDNHFFNVITTNTVQLSTMHGLLLLRASPRALTPRNTPIHPVSVILSTSRAVHTGPIFFRLVPMSTILAVQVYIFGSVSPPGRHIILPCGTHHNFGVHGWVPIDREWPDPWKAFHLG